MPMFLCVKEYLRRKYCPDTKTPAIKSMKDLTFGYDSYAQAVKGLGLGPSNSHLYLEYLDEIKSHESPPKIVNIFSEKEIKMMQELYLSLPERVFNKKQNIRKKLQNISQLELFLYQWYFAQLTPPLLSETA